MRKFKTLEEMERFYYGDLNADVIQKNKDAVLSSDTAWWQKLVGKKVWSQINYERNAFAAIPKEPWVKTMWRIETSAGVTFPSGGLAEGTASNFTNVADSTHPTLASASAPPKLIDHGWGMTWKQYMLGDVDSTVDAAWLAEQKGKAHARAISAYLVQAVDITASNGFESLDRVASSSAEGGHVSDTTDVEIYGLGTRDASTTYDAQVSSSGSTDATLRDLTVDLIDSVWSSVTAAGGYPKAIFTHYNTLKVWSALLEAERRFDVLGEAMYVPRYGGAAGVDPGLEAGFRVATFFGVPIIPCQDYDFSHGAAARTNEVGPIMFGDMDYIRMGMIMPTVYSESAYPGDAINLDNHGIEGHYYTIGELRCYNFLAQGKLTDIK